MMHDWTDGARWGGGGWIAMLVIMAVFVVMAVWAVVTLVRHATPRRLMGPDSSNGRPEASNMTRQSSDAAPGR